MAKPAEDTQPIVDSDNHDPMLHGEVFAGIAAALTNSIAAAVQPKHHRCLFGPWRSVDIHEQAVLVADGDSALVGGSAQRRGQLRTGVARYESFDDAAFAGRLGG